MVEGGRDAAGSGTREAVGIKVVGAGIGRDDVVEETISVFVFFMYFVKVKEGQ